MAISEPLRLCSVEELVSAIAARAISPVELFDEVAAHIESLEPVIHAFVTLQLEKGREAAVRKEALLVRGEQAGRLEGIPIGIKDLVAAKGFPTTYGSLWFTEDVSDYDAIEVERLRMAGAIIIGKTNTPAWGLKEMCENLVTEATRNPWDLSRTPGGSSGGAAAAVAGGYGPLAHGTDGAGSVRIPAAWSGVFGMKPSLGRVPLWPARDIWAARIHAGPLAYRVRDASVMLDVMAGPDPRDPLSIEESWNGFSSVEQMRLAGLRVAWCPDLGFARIDGEILALSTRAAMLFETLGAKVEPVDDPGWGDPGWWHTVLYRAEAAHRIGPLLEKKPEWIDSSVAEVVRLGQEITAEELLTAQEARTAFYNRAQAFMERYDALLTPTMPCSAWIYGQAPAPIDGSAVSAIGGGRWPLVYAFNVTGWPAATVPCGMTASGLPVGLQIVAPWHQDRRCLELAAAFEEAQPWVLPPLAK